jgi:outer membrane protein, heavy metal efflux system
MSIFRRRIVMLVIGASLAIGSSAFTQDPAKSTPPVTIIPVTTLKASAEQADALTLGELELLALEKNPTLAQAAALVDIARAKSFQAGLHMNPVVGYEGEQMGLRGERSSARWGERQGAFIQQEIITGGKLQLSRLKYQKEAFAAEIQAHAQRIRVVNGLQIAFYETLATQRLVEIEKRTLKIAEDAQKTTAELVNVGQANEPDLLQAEVEANRARVSLKKAEARHRQARNRLAVAVGVPDLDMRPLAGELEPADPPISREETLVAILRDSPEIQVALAEVERDQIAVERERREPIPNVIVRGATGYNFENRSTTTDISVGIRLPVWDRNQGTIVQAQADLARARAEVTRVELSVRHRFADVYQEYESALASVKDYREQSLPKARKARDLYQEFFKKRRAAWPQVLVAERTLTHLEEDYVDALFELRRSEVRLRGLLLGDDGLATPPAPTPRGHIEATPRPR